MKNFIARLFKKKTPESKPPDDSVAKDSSPVSETEEKDPKSAEKPARDAEAIKTEPEKKDAEGKEPAKAGPVQEITKKDTPPVLVPLYGKTETPTPEIPGAKAAPHQHLPFEDELQAAITTLVDDLAEVYPQTFEEWEDGFRRDDNPEQEIAGWLHLAGVLTAMSNKYSFGSPEKKECFNILIACFTGSRDTVRTRSKSELLSDEQFDQAITYFYEGGY